MTESNSSPELAPNIQEFNEITAVVFAQLYIAHPLTKTLEPLEVAKTLGIDHPNDTLPSGRTFNDVFAHTVGWLVRERYIYPNGAHPRDRVQLTDKALAAMNVVPPSLNESRGAVLADAVNEASKGSSRSSLWRNVGKIIGGIINGML